MCIRMVSSGVRHRTCSHALDRDRHSQLLDRSQCTSLENSVGFLRRTKRRKSFAALRSQYPRRTPLPPRLGMALWPSVVIWTRLRIRFAQSSMKSFAHPRHDRPTRYETTNFVSASIPTHVQTSPQPSCFFSALTFFAFAPTKHKFHHIEDGAL
jgi:hypothetical protein